jgi:uncharacterized membrane protein YsdA (DUF1294 family)
MIWIAGTYLLLSVITFAAYGLDKRRAIKGQWRIKERTLHLFEFLGGWPGGLLGQNVFRHKRRKLSYMLVTAIVIALHVAGWVAYFWMRRM